MQESKKVLFVNTHSIPDYHYGGVVESGSKIYKHLKKIDPNISLVTVSKNPEKVIDLVGSDGVCCKSLCMHRWGFSVGLVFALWIKVRDSDMVFSNGTVTFPTVLAQFYSLMQKKKFIVSLRGAVEPWRMMHKKWKKYLYYRLVVIPLLRRSAIIHVTAKQEAGGLTALGVTNYFVCSNGIDLAEYSKETFVKFECESDLILGDTSGKLTFLFLSRIDHEKGLDILIEAYKKFSAEIDKNESVLYLVGPNNQNYLKTLLLDSNSENIKHLDGLYGHDKMRAIRQSDLVILPSYSENFGNIIAEALACERPVITTTGTPWREIVEHECGYYVEPTANALFCAMLDFFKKADTERISMGLRGRRYVAANFDWRVKANIINSNILDCLHED